MGKISDQNMLNIEYIRKPKIALIECVVDALHIQNIRSFRNLKRNATKIHDKQAIHRIHIVNSAMNYINCGVLLVFYKS